MSNFKIDYAKNTGVHPLRSRIRMVGIRYDYIAELLDVEKSRLSLWLCGKRTFPKDIERTLTNYIREIEKVNRDYE